MRLLLDAHLSPAIAQRLNAEGTDIVTLRDWRGSNYLDAPDDQILVAALAEERVLVTFDSRTIQPLVNEWAQTGRHHAGVVLINRKTIRQDDIGGLIRALRMLVANTGEQDWRDRVVFLQAVSTS
jgi:predicted nuclease of predicted toxin-antitoxin system